MVFERHLDVITKNLALISNNNLEKILWKYFKGTASVSEIKSINPWLDEDRKNVQFFATSKEAYIEIIANIGNTINFLSRQNKYLKLRKRMSDKE